MRGVGSLDKIQIQNVRSLKDTGEVTLSPITLLVGENSSGKSTFLRLFPLIKQSISKRTDGPLLWAGDVDDYVDFGSFAETVTNDGSADMTFCFSFAVATRDDSAGMGLSMRSPKFKKMRNNLPDTCSVRYSITISQYSGHEYISKLNVRINRSRFEFELPPTASEGKITVDGIPIQRASNQKRRTAFMYSHTEFARSAIFEYNLPLISDVVNRLTKQFVSDEPEMITSDGFFFSNQRSYAISLMQFIGECLCLGNSPDVIQEYMIPPATKSADIIDEMYQNIIVTLSRQDASANRKTFADFELLFLYSFFSHIEDYLSAYFRRVHYIAPLRASAERYYRLRNLAIDEVDYQGKNLAMFLSGLEPRRLAEFQKWTQKYFGFHVLVHKSGGHLSIKITLGSAKEAVNMSDTGFGYSQILPIITQIWDLSTNPRPTRVPQKKVPLVIAIEQPELHLHPALQSKLARALLSSLQLAKDNGYNLQLLIETHSETILNYFGLAITRGALSSRDVSVVLFDKKPQTGHTEVRCTGFNDDGYLKDWMVGFFSPKEW